MRQMLVKSCVLPMPGSIAIAFARILAVVLPVILILPLISASQAKTADFADLCESAAREASALTGVPFAVLQAITAVETGRHLPGSDRQLHPWPWTVNQAGDGHWFDTKEQALAYATAARERGISNIDIGCFQLNHRWHADTFASLQAMFDPRKNALHAAEFLRSLHDKYGDWSEAAGAYHSKTPEYAARYRIKFDAVLAGLAGQALPTVQDYAVLVPRQNGFPLLKVGARGSGASLVPLSGGGQSLIARQP